MKRGDEKKLPSSMALVFLSTIILASTFRLSSRNGKYSLTFFDCRPGIGASNPLSLTARDESSRISGVQVNLSPESVIWGTLSD